MAPEQIAGEMTSPVPLGQLQLAMFFQDGGACCFQLCNPRIEFLRGKVTSCYRYPVSISPCHCRPCLSRDQPLRHLGFQKGLKPILVRL